MWRCRLAVCYRRHGRSLLGYNFHSFLQQKAGFSLAKCGQTALGSSYFVFPFFFFFFNTSPRSALRPAPRLHHGLRAVPQRPERGGAGGGAAGGCGPSVSTVRRRAHSDGAADSPAAAPPLQAAGWGGRRSLGGVGECGGPEEGPDERNPTRAGQLGAERAMRRCGA